MRDRSSVAIVRPSHIACLFLATGVLLLAASPALAIKIVTYNALNYTGNTSDTFGLGREPHLRTVLTAVDADVVCVQELANATGYANFFVHVLNTNGGPGAYTAAPFTDGLGGGGDNALYYRGSALTYLTRGSIQTQPAGGIRDISWFKLRLNGYTTSAAELYIFVCHLSSGGGAVQREIEADVYRDWAEANLPPGAFVVHCGDFNMDGTGEAAWTRFTETRATNVGRLRDPINISGTWNNNAGLALFHTQSPLISQSGYTGGGIDDRFDLLLISDNLQDSVAGQMDFKSGSYKTFGNDGQHFNKAITDSPTIPEGAAMANALYFATDHMPVLMEINGPAKMAADAALAFGTVIQGASGITQVLNVSNPAPLPAMALTYSLAPPGGYSASTNSVACPAGNANTHTVTMLTSTPGTRNATLVVSGNAPEQPSLNVNLTGNVLAHAVPSTQSGTQVLSGSLNFGSHLPGGFSDQSAAVHNAGYSSQQAALNVYAMNLTGSPRFSVPAFSANTVTTSPALYTVHFDSSAAPPGLYTATVTFSTRDQQDLPGATNLSSVSYSLSATVLLQKGDMNHDGCVNALDVPLFAAVLLNPSAATPADRDVADMNADTANDGKDIPQFIAALMAGCP